MSEQAAALRLEETRMDETKWTPGEWRPLEKHREVWTGNVLLAEVYAHDPDQHEIGPGEAEQAVANTILMAASPALYAALVEAEAALAVKASLRDAEQARVERALEGARRALATARGEQNDA